MRYAARTRKPASSAPRGRLQVSTSHLAPTAIAPRDAISQSGDPTIAIKYVPEAGDKGSKIVFIQVMRALLDGVAVKPGDTHSTFTFRDADTTADFYSVDYTSGEADPYYNGDDAGDKFAGQVQGDATATPKVASEMNDTPSYEDGHFPAGKTKLRKEFRSIAFSAAGADKGTFYAYAKWSFNKEKGKASTIQHHGSSTNTALPKSRAAIDLWCTNHGFTLPS